MKFSPDLIESLVPQELPPLFLDQTLQTPIDPNISATIEFRSFVWANIIARVYLAQIQYKRVYHFSTGFVHIPEYLQRDLPTVKMESSFAFGGYLLLPGNSDRVQVETIRIREYTFPIVKHFGSIELHSSIPHLSSGTSTCWVRSLTPSAIWSDGILTCRHLVSTLSIGSSVALNPTRTYSKPTSGSMADIDECTLDAAIVEINSADFPKGVKAIHLIASVYPGLAIEFTGQSGKYTGTVLRAFQMSNYYGNLFGHRVVIDCYGKHGDSGSFVKTTATPSEGVGIYMGTIPDGRGGDEGICQCLLQVRDFFEIEFYI